MKITYYLCITDIHYEITYGVLGKLSRRGLCAQVGQKHVRAPGQASREEGSLASDARPYQVADGGAPG